MEKLGMWKAWPMEGEEKGELRAIPRKGRQGRRAQWSHPSSEGGSPAFCFAND